MSITLTKGGNINLTKTEPSLTKIRVALGWEPRATDGKDFDLDASAFLVGSDERAHSEDDFIFYNHLTNKNGSVTHTGDNLTGAGAGDDETINVDLSKLDADIQKIEFVVTIHQADIRKQSFGQVDKAFIRLVNDATGDEIARYDLTEDASTETAMLFGELYRSDAEWKFRAVGQGYQGGLASFVEKYGLSVAS